MNRRSLLKSTALVPLIRVENMAGLTRERRLSFLLEDDLSAQMIVTAHPSSRSAEAWRLDWQDRAFESRGEWYLQETETRELPPHLESLPGSLQFHTYIWGEAGEDGVLLVGAFRREYMACVIRLKSDDEPAMIRLAEFFADQRIPERWELLWNDAQLAAFLPTTETLGETVEPVSDLWP